MMELFDKLFSQELTAGYIVTQIIGFVGMAVLAYSYQRKTQRSILLFQMAAGVVFAVHYYLLGAYTGVAMNIVASLRSLTYSNRGKNKLLSSMAVPVFFCIVSIVMAALTWTGPLSVLPAFAMASTSFVLWSTNTQRLRILSVPSSACWMIFNGYSGSYAGIITEAFNLCSIAVALVRYGKGKHKKAQTAVVLDE